MFANLFLIAKRAPTSLVLPEQVAMLTHWQHAARPRMAARERPSIRAVAELADPL